MPTALSFRPLPRTAASPHGFELHVDGDVVAESDDRDALTTLMRRYSGYGRVAIFPARRARG
jgi:hypothetical protein